MTLIIGNRSFIEIKKVNRVHNDEHCILEKNKDDTRTLCNDYPSLEYKGTEWLYQEEGIRAMLEERSLVYACLVEGWNKREEEIQQELRTQCCRMGFHNQL